MTGVMGERALISVNGGPPRVVRVGESVDGMRVLGVRPDSVVVEAHGRRQEIRLGQGSHAGAAAPGTETDKGQGGGRLVLTADGRGHFTAQGSVNGLPLRFMVDTGASLVALPASFARRAGVNLGNAKPVMVGTANGTARAQQVVLNRIQVGDIRLNLVQALVVDDASLSIPLLGMSFLNRTNMVREGDTLVLTLRY